MNPLVATPELTTAPSSDASPAPQPAPRAPGFHLLVESLAPAQGATPRTVADLPVLEVPAGVAHLTLRRRGPAIVAARPRRPALVIEPVSANGHAQLLVLSPRGLRARLNGLALPAAALVHGGDQLQLDARAILHVTEFVRGGAAPPSPALVGRPCGVCRVPVTAINSVYVCTCGVPLHIEGPPVPEPERLECALLGDCPSCGSEVRLESGYVRLPEL